MNFIQRMHQERPILHLICITPFFPFVVLFFFIGWLVWCIAALPYYVWQGGLSWYFYRCGVIFKRSVWLLMLGYWLIVKGVLNRNET